jgi:hypothetical protein
VHINSFDPMTNKRHPLGPSCPRKSLLRLLLAYHLIPG